MEIRNKRGTAIQALVVLSLAVVLVSTMLAVTSAFAEEGEAEAEHVTSVFVTAAAASVPAPDPQPVPVKTGSTLGMVALALLGVGALSCFVLAFAARKKEEG